MGIRQFFIPAFLCLIGFQAPLKAESRQELFRKVLVVGADISSSERYPSVGALIAHSAGVDKGAVISHTMPRSTSAEHLVWIREILPKEKPTLVVALDLFFHDFKRSNIFWRSDRRRVQEIVGLLAENSHQVFIGNTVPLGVYLAPISANRELGVLAERYPNVTVIDIFTIFKDLLVWGYYDYNLGGQHFPVRLEDMMGEDKRPTELFLQLTANSMIDLIRQRNSEITEKELPFLSVLRSKDG